MAVSSGKASARSGGHARKKVSKAPVKRGDEKEAKTTKKNASKTKKLKGGKIPS